MAFLVKGGPGSAPTNPVLDLYTFVSGILTDANAIRIRIFDYTTPEKKALYNSGAKNDVQVFPANPGDHFQLDVLHLMSDTLNPGHKISVGHYFAPWVPSETAALGDYIIEWRYKETESTPEKVYCEEFVLITDSALSSTGTAGGAPCIEKIKLFMQDSASKNELIDQLEYTDQQYNLALEMAVCRFNNMPVTTNISVENFCTQFCALAIIGSAGYLLQSTAIEQLRNQLTYTDGNIHVGLKDKHQLYMQASQIKLQEFDNVSRQIKNMLNNEQAWGEVSSPYAYIGYGLAGIRGGGWGEV